MLYDCTNNFYYVFLMEIRQIYFVEHKKVLQTKNVTQNVFVIESRE